MKKVSLIVAATVPELGIGRNGNLPWRIAEDMKFFKETTTTTKDDSKQNAVIMGRKTWESIPKRFRPLYNRLNIVLTRNTESESMKELSTEENVMVSSSFDKVMETLSWPPYENKIESIFVIGGSEIYNLIMCDHRHFLESIYLTKVYGNNIECDTFLNKEQFNVESFDSNAISDKCNAIDKSTNNELQYEIVKLTPKSTDDEKDESESIPMNISTMNNVIDMHEEYQYLNAIERIINTGIEREDRTGTGTFSIFGMQMRYNLRNDIFPLLTTKNTYWRGVAEELLWFMNGETNANKLSAKKVRIWDANGSREFLDGRGLNHYEIGDLGPVYGFQWRHFGAEYKGMNEDYNGKGVDQLMKCIDMIKNNPTSRRIVMSAWNPSDLDKMALPPCHMFCQFYVDVKNKELSCQMYQRSADMGLGVPFNIASYSLLCRIIAQICDLKCGDFVHTIGDAHVYKTHVEPLKLQLKRKPYKFPLLKINPNKKQIEEFEYKDFKLIGYKHHARIKMKMAV